MASAKDISQHVVLTEKRAIREKCHQKEIIPCTWFTIESRFHQKCNEQQHIPLYTDAIEKLNQIIQSKVKETHLQIVQFLSNNIYDILDHGFKITHFPHSLLLSITARKLQQTLQYTRRYINVSKFAGIAQRCTRSWVILSAIIDTIIQYLYAICLEKLRNLNNKLKTVENG